MATGGLSLTVGFWFSFGIVALVPATAALGGSPPFAGPPPDKTSATSAYQVSAPGVKFMDGRVSLAANKQSLIRILNEIAQQTLIAIVPSAGVSDRLVSISFDDLKPDDALRLILKGYDAFFLVGSDAAGKTAASLKAVWVYPPGQGTGVEPIPLAQAASTTELQQHLHDSDPQSRARAVGGLAERNGNQARDSVVAALKDADPNVRTQALYGAENGGIDLPTDLLKDLATSDPAPEVRFLALDSLQGTPEGKAVAEQALHDPNQQVRDAAGQFLLRLQASQQPPAPNTQANPYAN